jgi:hypothetical protein
MKKKLFTIGFIFIFIGTYAQTKNSKLGFSAGFGFQQYKGDLGSNFYSFDRCMYGVGTVAFDYYLNKSLDIGFFGTLGDYSYCQPRHLSDEFVPVELRCPGCVGRIGMGDFKSRMASGGMMIKYKLSNGYILREESMLRPYVYAGMAINHITDRMQAKCVNTGDYYSINAGLGFKYYVNEKVNIGYKLGVGYFTSDKVDIQSGGTNDMYLQNSLIIGIDLF